MFNHGVLWPLLHWIQNEIKTMLSGHFNSWEEIAISCDQNDLVNIMLVCKRGNIKSDSHINAFLFDINTKIILRQSVHCFCACD